MWPWSIARETSSANAVGLPPFPADAIAVRAIITPEFGRWVVSLEITLVPDREDCVVVHRIADYPTERHAEIAARWMVRAAGRDLPRPPLGF